jgi:hypothetical protein
MIIKVYRLDGKVDKFDKEDGWHVSRDGSGDLTVIWHREDGIQTDRVHVYPVGAWKKLEVERS